MRTMAQDTHPRIVSLIASATEILHGLGCGALQVGRSHECDFPPEVLPLPALTAPKFKVEGSSAEIEDRSSLLDAYLGQRVVTS